MMLEKEAVVTLAAENFLSAGFLQYHIYVRPSPVAFTVKVALSPLAATATFLG